MSDPQFGMFTKDASFEHETVNFEFATATTNRLKPAFVVITGDLINKGGDAAHVVRAGLASAPAPTDDVLADGNLGDANFDAPKRSRAWATTPRTGSIESWDFQVEPI